MILQDKHATEQTDERFMKMAIEQALQAKERGEVPVGAVIVCKNRVIAKAFNLTQTLNDVTAHAEMQAITSAANALGGKYLNECTLYVTLEPCVMCAGAIGWAQFDRVVYGASDKKKGFSLFAPQAIHPKTKVDSGILSKECAEIIVDFFRNRR